MPAKSYQLCSWLPLTSSPIIYPPILFSHPGSLDDPQTDQAHAYVQGLFTYCSFFPVVCW